MSKQPESKNFHPFATVGARTEYGGRVTSGSGFVICGLPVACVGDIVTGIAMPESPKVLYAIVGSRLDNGDVITDSPHREPRTSTLFVPVDEHGTVIAGIESPRPCWTVS